MLFCPCLKLNCFNFVRNLNSYYLFFRSYSKPTDIYITEKTHIKAQEEKCQKILDLHGRVVLHGLGKAINRTINLALQMQAKGAGTVHIGAQTSSVDLTDDFIPETDDGEEMSTDRSKSAIHVHLYRSIDATPPASSDLTSEKESSKS